MTCRVCSEILLYNYCYGSRISYSFSCFVKLTRSVILAERGPARRDVITPLEALPLRRSTANCFYAQRHMLKTTSKPTHVISTSLPSSHNVDYILAPPSSITTTVVYNVTSLMPSIRRSLEQRFLVTIPPETAFHRRRSANVHRVSHYLFHRPSLTS